MKAENLLLPDLFPQLEVILHRSFTCVKVQLLFCHFFNIRPKSLLLSCKRLLHHIIFKHNHRGSTRLRQTNAYTIPLPGLDGWISAKGTYILNKGNMSPVRHFTYLICPFKFLGSTIYMHQFDARFFLDSSNNDTSNRYQETQIKM